MGAGSPGPAQTRARTSRRCWALAGVGIATALAWLGVDQAAINRAAGAARRAVADRRYDEAEAPLARWLQSRPGAAEAHYLKARIALARDRPRETLDELNRAAGLGYPD